MCVPIDIMTVLIDHSITLRRIDGNKSYIYKSEYLKIVIDDI